MTLIHLAPYGAAGGGGMTAKEYLQQARFLDQRIDSKIAQVASLNDLATKCTATLTGMPRNTNRGDSTMADAVCKIVDLQAEINRDIDRLVDVKREVMTVVDQLDPTCIELLTKRYFDFKTWEQIAARMNISPRWLHHLRAHAIEQLNI